MHAKELLELERRDIRALHYTWIAFFLTFYVWFNMAPLATSMLQTESYLTPDHIKLFLIANVARNDSWAGYRRHGIGPFLVRGVCFLS